MFWSCIWCCAYPVSVFPEFWGVAIPVFGWKKTHISMRARHCQSTKDGLWFNWTPLVSKPFSKFDRRSFGRTSIDQGDFGDLGCSRVFRPKNLWLITVGRPKAPNWHRIEKWAFWTFNGGRPSWSSVNWRPLSINPWWVSVQPKDLGIKRKLFLDEPSEPKLVILGRPEFHGASLMTMEVSHDVILGWKPT